MSRPMADTPKRRPRRQFTDEFKASAVRLVLDEGKTVGAAARDLDLTETAVREWVRRAQADRTQGRTGSGGDATETDVTRESMPFGGCPAGTPFGLRLVVVVSAGQDVLIRDSGSIF